MTRRRLGYTDRMKGSTGAACAVFFAFVLALPAAASAQEQSVADKAAMFAQSVPWQGIGMNALERARRSIAIGPFIGLHGVRGPGNDMDGAISFGIGLSRFDVPIIPDRSEIESILKDRFKALFIQKFNEALQGDVNGRGIDPKQIAKQAWNDVLSAYLKGRKHQMLEKPGLRLHAEATKLFVQDAWQGRITASIGIGPIALGFSGGGEFGDANFAFVGIEATKPLVFGEARTPVLELFGRLDRGFGEGHNDLDASLGARFLLDIL